MKTKNWLIRLYNEEKGQTLILFAVLVIVFLGATAFVVDAGYLFFQKRHLQNTADAAALAAVMKVPDSSNVESEARHYAELHGVIHDGNGTGVHADVFGREVRVTVRKEYERYFGRIWSNEPYRVVAMAEARRDPRIKNVAPFVPLPHTYGDVWDGWKDSDREEKGPGRVFISPLILGFAYDENPYSVSEDGEFYGYITDTAINPDYYLEFGDNIDSEDLLVFRNFIRDVALSNGRDIQLALVSKTWDQSPSGYIDVDPDGTSSKSASEFRSILCSWGNLDVSWFDLEDQPEHEVYTGLMESAIKRTGGVSCFENFLNVEGEEFYLLLPHPYLVVNDPHSLISSYVIAKVEIEIGSNLPGDSDEDGKAGFYYRSDDIAEALGINANQFERNFVEEAGNYYLVGAKLIDVYHLEEDRNYLIDVGIIADYYPYLTK